MNDGTTNMKDSIKEILQIFSAFSFRERSCRHFVSIAIGKNISLAMEYRPMTKNLVYAFIYDIEKDEKLKEIPIQKLTYLCKEGFVDKFSKNISNISKYSMDHLDNHLEKLMDEHIKAMDELEP